MGRGGQVKEISAWLQAAVFALFIAIKLAGTSLASWSWWWLLMPIVPLLGLVVKHFGL